jgi:hypothetical protein
MERIAKHAANEITQSSPFLPLHSLPLNEKFQPENGCHSRLKTQINNDADGLFRCAPEFAIANASANRQTSNSLRGRVRTQVGRA